MKKHTIRINVCLDVENKRKTNLEHNNSLKGARLPDNIISEESIHQSGLMDAKPLKQTAQPDWVSINDNTISSVKCSLESSDDFQYINFMDYGKEKGNDN